MNQAMSASRPGQLVKMRVYLKDGVKNPPLDSFRLASGNSVLWRFVNENALLFNGGTVEYRGDQVDSIILENGRKGVPYGKWMTFLNQAGPINYYGIAPDTTDAMPYLIKKGSGDIVRATPKKIRPLVEGDPEAEKWMDRYGHRWWWKSGAAAAGLGMMVGGFSWSRSTITTDSAGHTHPGSYGGLYLALGGLAVFCVPLTPVVDFIWKGMPKKALDSYNRNHRQRQQ